MTNEQKKPSVGEQYWAYLIEPTLTYPKKVTVTKTNVSQSLIDCGIDYDVEDENGHRCWNPYLIVNFSDKVKNNIDIKKYHADNLVKWKENGYNFSTRKYDNHDLSTSK